MSKEYYKTKESVDEYIKLAKDVSGKELIEKLMQFLPTASTLLEIGSGPGTDWRILKGNYKVTGSDSSTEFIRRLTLKHPNHRFLELDAVDLALKEKFDGVYSNKVMHHLKDHEFIQSIKKQYDILNSNGIICHSFWKGKGSEVYNGLFVNYHSEDSLKKVLSERFKILHLMDYKEFEEEDSILLIARKNEADH